ncbi:hypothetical protein BDV24DRAFT_129607 [Aspergillus arachidicola]|uniref:Uncharacterized protein n=1 Tax=Aspergillus arachidicola TaxID=656916 RepID=A0A5N6YEW4_9EURO|nr:hypothetical protein BDV24DRAFT_129607 [Aspergillus arachidicola]
MVVGSLLAGIQNGDGIADLHKRPTALPSDLEQPFERLLNTVEAFYFESLCHLMQRSYSTPGPHTGNPSPRGGATPSQQPV